MNDIPKNIKSLSSKHTTLVVVTKGQPSETLKKLLTIDELQHIGENRWQDFKKRYLETGLYQRFKEKNIQFHFIGHLQTNKVKEVVKYFDVIQSVDSLKLLESINEEAKKQDKIQEILLQINISFDEKKFGFSKNIEEILNLTLPNIKIKGLMTILKADLTKEYQFKYFSELKVLADQTIPLTSPDETPIISMGMSKDYKIALKAGSNMIRIGSAIFRP